jgi:hypothetical protein
MFPCVHSNSVLSANSSTLFKNFVQNLGIIEGWQKGASSAQIGPQNIFWGDCRKSVRWKGYQVGMELKFWDPVGHDGGRVTRYFQSTALGIVGGVS